MMKESERAGAAREQYWKASLRWVGILLGIWFVVSLGCGVLWREWLDANFPNVGTAPFGFWMAQQGSIICFVLLLIAYAKIMSGLDAKYAVDEEGSR